jgi:hypothetical protein
MQDPTRDSATPGTVRGPRIVLAIIGALVIVVAFVLIGFAIFEPEGAPCATGELAANRLVEGRYEPRNETFATVREAEAFICHDVPELQADGWRLDSITAERTLPLEFLVEGEGVGVVTLGYVHDASGRSLTLDAAPFSGGASYFESQVPPQHTKEPAEVDGNAATAYRFGINPDAVTLIWTDDSLEHRAATVLAPDFELEDLMGVLETLD